GAVTGPERVLGGGGSARRGQWMGRDAGVRGLRRAMLRVFAWPDGLHRQIGASLPRSGDDGDRPLDLVEVHLSIAVTVVVAGSL
ncbi:unnamed protein product, partial [Urochloa humidicola]